MSLQSFTDAYIEAALWSSQYGEEGEEKNMDDGEHDIAPETLAKMEADCKAFYGTCSNLLTEGACFRSAQGVKSHSFASLRSDSHSNRGSGRYHVDEQAGHDFWLTRNGHGAGFWDGDWIEPAATILDKTSKHFGNVDLYVGDDRLIYQS